MLILKVIHKGNPAVEYPLEEQEEFIIGRKKDSFIVLENNYGISRKHLKVQKAEDSKVKVECLSELGGLVFNGKESKEILVGDGEFFSLKDYHFHLIHSLPQESPPPEDGEKDQPKEASDSLQKESKISSEESLLKKILSKSSKEFNNNDSSLQKKRSTMTEAPTVMAHAENHLKPCLVISLSEDEEDQTVALEDGDQWVVGRDPSCDICVEDINISRQHFKIKKKEGKYYIKDLGSSNGTYVNDDLLPPRKNVLLTSGANISILDTEIYFEIRNPQVEKKISSFPAPLPPPQQNDALDLPVEAASQTPSPPPSVPSPNVIMSETIVTPLPGHSSKKKRIIFISVIIALLAGGGFFLSQDTPEPKKEEKEEKDSSFSNLDPETQEQAKDLYSLARQQYQMKKYELCFNTLKKLHSIIPYYEQSLSLINTCETGAENIKIQLELEAKNKEKLEAQKKVESITSRCQNRFSSFKTMQELKNCLSEALEIDPENTLANSLISDFESDEFLKKQKQIQQALKKKKISKEMKVYSQAKSLKDEGLALEAVPAYKAFLKRRHPPGMEDTIETAQNELKEIEDEISTKTSEFLKSCQELTESKQYKEAYEACKKVFTVSPGNPKAAHLINSAQQEIKLMLKPIYDESVLNESLGRIDMAKKQWKEIIEKDTLEGSYYKKASRKMSKY